MVSPEGIAPASGVKTGVKRYLFDTNILIYDFSDTLPVRETPSPVPGSSQPFAFRQDPVNKPGHCVPISMSNTIVCGSSMNLKMRR